jgi:methionyl-tRNA synthetase
MTDKAYYVTTPIYYVNDAPHIGHAYTTTAGDVLTRWHRQRGEDVWYLTGVDEHGTKVQRAAEAGGVSPQEWVDRLVADAWLPVLGTVNAANDDFIRTTSDRHKLAVQRFWEVVRENGYVYAAPYAGPYCVGCEEFKLAGDLVAGEGDFKGQQLCPVHGRPVEQVEEDNWFFKLSALAERLIAHYETNPDAIQPQSAYNEVMSFLRQGLMDISMSRSSVKWGIPLPWDSDQVVYVWFDALLNYITAVGYGADPGTVEAELFERTWPVDVHLVGKDILRFHAVYWPAMLMAAELPLPRKVFAHGWLLVGGEKMSKTRLTGIAPAQIIDHFGADAFRYYFLRAITFGNDGSFSWEDMSARYTSELANGLGNLASRATAMVEKYCSGAVPAPSVYTDADLRIQQQLVEAVDAADTAYLALDFSTGIGAVNGFVEAVNRYVTEQEPWKVAKDDSQIERLHTILYVLCDSLRAIAVLHHALMPRVTALMWEQIGAVVLGGISDQRVQHAALWGLLPVGARVTKGEILFPRLEDPVEA